MSFNNCFEENLNKSAELGVKPCFVFFLLQCFGRAVAVSPDKGYSKYMNLGQLFEGLFMISKAMYHLTVIYWHKIQ